MWIQNPAERTLSPLWCSFPRPLEHANVGCVMLSLMLLPVGLVLEGSNIATEGAGVLRLWVRG